MAADPDGLDLDLAKAVYSEMLAVVEREANRRHRLAKMVGSCYGNSVRFGFRDRPLLLWRGGWKMLKGYGQNKSFADTTAIVAGSC